MLLKVFYKDKRKEIVSHFPDKDGPFAVPEGSIGAQVFRYEYIHQYLPPSISSNPFNGKHYIVPGWIEIHPDTRLEDIRWEKPEIQREKPEKNEWTFESSSSDAVYKVRQKGDKLSCSCPGVWRSKDRRCKHIKEVEKQLS